MKCSFLFALVTVSAFSQSKSPVVQQAGNCAVNISGNHNTATITCTGVDPTLAKQIQLMLNLAKADAKAIRDLTSKIAALIKEQQNPRELISVTSNNQQGGITAGKVEINPAPLEQSWQLSIAKCDESAQSLGVFKGTVISLGVNITNDNGSRVAKILANCFKRLEWTPGMSYLPDDADGVVVGMSKDGPMLDAIQSALRSFGLRVGRPDIRPEHRDQVLVIVGRNPIVN